MDDNSNQNRTNGNSGSEQYSWANPQPYNDTSEKRSSRFQYEQSEPATEEVIEEIRIDNQPLPQQEEAATVDEGVAVVGEAVAGAEAVDQPMEPPYPQQPYGQPEGQPFPQQPYGQPEGQPFPQQPYGQPEGQPFPQQPYGQQLSKQEIKARRKQLKKENKMIKKEQKGNKGKIVAIVVPVVILVLILGVYFTLFYDFDSSKETKNQTEATVPSATVIDNQGNCYAAVVDEGGVTYAAVKDSDGNTWQVAINPDGSLGDTVGSLNGVFGETTTGAVINETVTSAFNGEVSVIESTTQAQTEATTEADETTASADTTAAGGNAETTGAAETTTAATSDSTPGANYARYQKMFTEGNYYMAFSTEGSDLDGYPIVSASKDGKVYFTTSIEDIKCEVLYLPENDKSYIIIESMKMYGQLPKKLMGEEVDLSELNFVAPYFSDTIKAEDMTTDYVEIDGKQLTRESIEKSNGVKQEYYFSDGVLVRIDTTDTDGKVTKWFFTQITNEVDDSLFETPKDYRYINFSLLGLF